MEEDFQPTYLMVLCKVVKYLNLVEKGFAASYLKEVILKKITKQVRVTQHEMHVIEDAGLMVSKAACHNGVTTEFAAHSNWSISPIPCDPGARVDSVEPFEFFTCRLEPVCETTYLPSRQ